ncbi:hypothetical protein [Ralstonia mojiangensis]|uniref:hypothetical protein n=1 Tax=Ralstonia mojiangensis TaxID=2953895 RepID=UPI00209165F2|nr:hypothetical protein [Ralstonia mojiangensis]MCO5412881.1 hypothetical protein [Ralstonia mojiangensis]
MNIPDSAFHIRSGNIPFAGLRWTVEGSLNAFAKSSLQQSTTLLKRLSPSANEACTGIAEVGVIYPPVVKDFHCRIHVPQQGVQQRCRLSEAMRALVRKRNQRKEVTLTMSHLRPLNICTEAVEGAEQERPALFKAQKPIQRDSNIDGGVFHGDTNPSGDQFGCLALLPLPTPIACQCNAESSESGPDSARSRSHVPEIFARIEMPSGRDPYAAGEPH